MPELDEREQGLFGKQSWEQRLTTVTKGEEIGGEGVSLREAREFYVRF